MSTEFTITVQTKHRYFSPETSDFLFSVVGEGCRRKIALGVIQPPVNDRLSFCTYECRFDVSNRFNNLLANPLFQADDDPEVAEYLPVPLRVRLDNLQGLFEFILSSDEAVCLRVFIDSGFKADDYSPLPVPIEDFAEKMEQIITGMRTPAFYYEFCWTK